MRVKVINTTPVDIRIDPMLTGKLEEIRIIFPRAQWSGSICEKEYKRLMSTPGVQVRKLRGLTNG